MPIALCGESKRRSEQTGFVARLDRWGDIVDWREMPSALGLDALAVLPNGDVLVAGFGTGKAPPIFEPEPSFIARLPR